MTSVNNRPEILTKLGVGSGLDTTALIEALVNAETEGVKETLDNKESEYKAQISAFSQIKNNLKVFNDNLQIIQDNNALGYAGSSSDKTVATFTVNGNQASQAVNSSLTVTSLATAHTLTGPSLSSHPQQLEQDKLVFLLELGLLTQLKEEGKVTLQMECLQ